MKIGKWSTCSVLIALVLLMSSCSDGDEDQAEVKKFELDSTIENPVPVKSELLVKNVNDAATAMANYKFATPEVDIVGLQLGMTEEQVTKTIQKHDNSLTIQPGRRPIQYLALNENREAGKYLASISARHLGSSREFVTAVFLAPPHDSRVFAVTRYNAYQTHNHEQEILAEDYRASLIAKYGEPDVDQSNPNQIKYRWYLSPELTDCGVGMNIWANSNAIIPAAPYPAHFEQYKDRCGAILEITAAFQASTELVTTAESALIDFKGLVKTRLDYVAYVAELSRKATQEKREQLKGATKPTL